MGSQTWPNNTSYSRRHLQFALPRGHGSICSDTPSTPIMNRTYSVEKRYERPFSLTASSITSFAVLPRGVFIALSRLGGVALVQTGSGCSIVYEVTIPLARTCSYRKMNWKSFPGTYSAIQTRGALSSSPDWTTYDQ